MSEGVSVGGREGGREENFAVEVGGFCNGQNESKGIHTIVVLH